MPPDTQTVEVEIIVRVRDADGKKVGHGGCIKWSAEPMPRPEGPQGTIMALRQRRMIAEGIKDMARDFVEGHFRDTRKEIPLRVVHKSTGDVLETTSFLEDDRPKRGDTVFAAKRWWVVLGHFRDTRSMHTLLVRPEMPFEKLTRQTMEHKPETSR